LVQDDNENIYNLNDGTVKDTVKKMEGKHEETTNDQSLPTQEQESHPIKGTCTCIVNDLMRTYMPFSHDVIRALIMLHQQLPF